MPRTRQSPGATCARETSPDEVNRKPLKATVNAQKRYHFLIHFIFILDLHPSRRRVEAFFMPVPTASKHPLLLYRHTVRTYIQKPCLNITAPSVPLYSCRASISHLSSEMIDSYPPFRLQFSAFCTFFSSFCTFSTSDIAFFNIFFLTFAEQ